MSGSGRLLTRLLAALLVPILALVAALAAAGELTPLVGAGALGLTLAAAGVIWAAVRPFEKMAVAADQLSEERLPHLVEALMNPGDDDETYLAATIQLLPVDGPREQRRLAKAYNDLQSLAVTVAARQADLLRKGITDLYVNLARRNQSLLERQIGLLDRLEAAEQDPDVLENLYQIDHLSTRMRRNAESLLVLANADSSRRSRAIGVADVVRSALSEVEAYDRVDIGKMAAATVHGPAVSDVAHILAELLENAAQFSPPHTRVTVEGSRTGGSYQVVITDEGMGLTDDKLDALNDILRDPPVTGLALGHSLGCLVAARLAARHGITVRLRPAPARGVAAYVILPRHLVSDDTVVAPPASSGERSSTRPTPSVRSTPSPTPLPAKAAVPPAARQPSTLREALPALESFNAGILAMLEGKSAAAVDGMAAAEPVWDPAPAVAPAVEAEGPATVVAQPAVEPVAVAAPSSASIEMPAPQPVAPDPVTVPASAGGRAPLTRRVPGASGVVESARPAEPATRRSPEQVRSMLSKYRSGLSAGRAALNTAQEDPTE